MAGGGPITSLPPKVLAGLAKSLAGFARMPEAFAQAHIVARGGKAPEEDGLGAVARGRLLKMLSDEVLAEWSEVADDAAADDDARPSRDPPKRASGKKAEAKPASSAETVMTRAVGVVDPGEDSDESDDSGAVGSGLKPSSARRKEEAARGKPESAVRVTQSESSSDASDEDARPSEGSADAPSDTDSYDDSADESDDVSEDDSNWFGKAATEAPPPAGANPFAAMASDFDPAAEAAAQIAEAKRVVAERRAAAEAEADALARAVGGVAIADANADAEEKPAADAGEAERRKHFVPTAPTRGETRRRSWITHRRVRRPGRRGRGGGRRP